MILQLFRVVNSNGGAVGTLVAIPIIVLLLGVISLISRKLTSRIGRNPRQLILFQVAMGVVVLLIVVFAALRVASIH
ncbi:hypothetical protein [Xanthomonas vesicatoria]|uniref:hypothetical protein n=1 Tax=Xanthomonas vesicatoria TaxID=56460 RepID=UPI00126A40F7|nr:hypothetical protein [Xanthomonas vesicatoria]MCC8619055.1 hypothetical protein [Xanthomonas vesicatoria]